MNFNRQKSSKVKNTAIFPAYLPHETAGNGEVYTHSSPLNLKGFF